MRFFRVFFATFNKGANGKHLIRVRIVLLAPLFNKGAKGTIFGLFLDGFFHCFFASFFACFFSIFFVAFFRFFLLLFCSFFGCFFACFLVAFLLVFLPVFFAFFVCKSGLPPAPQMAMLRSGSVHTGHLGRGGRILQRWQVPGPSGEWGWAGAVATLAYVCEKGHLICSPAFKFALDLL